MWMYWLIYVYRLTSHLEEDHPSKFSATIWWAWANGNLANKHFPGFVGIIEWVSWKSIWVEILTSSLEPQMTIHQRQISYNFMVRIYTVNLLRFSIGLLFLQLSPDTLLLGYHFYIGQQRHGTIIRYSSMGINEDVMCDQSFVSLSTHSRASYH